MGLLPASEPAVGQVELYVNFALLFGLIILGGTLGARLFQRFHIPQVVGSIAVGIVLGQDVLNVISEARVEALEPFTKFALGIVGFMIGGELRAEVFKKYGRQFFIILFSEGFGAFILVAVATAGMLWFMHRDLRTSIALGIVFGAIASATAPAATVNVLWEYKARGPLTATILAIVALDDALSLLLYKGSATGAKALLGAADSSVIRTTAVVLEEILGTVLLGFLAGVFLWRLLKLIRAEDKILQASIACLLIVVGISMVLGMDPILPAMVFGVTLANVAPRQSKSVFELVDKFSPLAYVAFFVLAGAHLELGRLGWSTVAVTATYIVFRVAGKAIGAWTGARYCRMPTSVQKYLGICLLPQAGVAIGLAILSREVFEPVNPSFGRIIITVVMTATFIKELLGPVLVKIGINAAGEAGRYVTEEDLINTYTVRDVMDVTPTTIPQGMPLPAILKLFSGTESLYYPVVDEQTRLVGVVTIAGIRNMFANQDVAGWLLACDVAEPPGEKTTPESPLADVLEEMRRYHVEDLPVVAAEDEERLLGVLHYAKTLRAISAEVLRRRETADALGAAAS
jgi:Kef-type K+ transport system membrane component KefB